MNSPTLTVIVPVYNTAPWLQRCLDSVLGRETPGDVEIVAVNDGSTDASPAILRDYAARFPRQLRVLEQVNSGHGPALLAGLAAARGRYVRVLDSDDWLDTPGFLRYVNCLRGCREDLVVTPYSREYAETGAESLCAYPFLRDGGLYRFEDIDWREGMDYFCLASATWRRELLRAAGLKLPGCCSYVDMLYALLPLPLVRTFRFLDIPLYRYAIGRPDQSMAPAVLRRQTPMHQRVLTRLLRFAAPRLRTLSPGKRAYLLLVLRYMLHTHAQLLCVEGSGSLRSFRAARRLDRVLRRHDALLQTAESLPLLRLSRRFGYWNVLLLPAGAARLLQRRLR